MTETELFVPEPKAPTRWYGRILDADRMIIGGGIVLAGFAAFFPWYVFLHQEEFGIRPMQSMKGLDAAAWPGSGLFAASPLATVVGDGEGPAEFDPLQTATTPAVTEQPAPGEDPLSQPFPVRPFELVHVANGRALIEDQSGMYIVRIGSVLPDNSRVERLEKRGEEWVIVTSEGEVIEP